LELSLVIPVHKAGSAVGTALIEKINVLKSMGIEYEVIVVEDGPDQLAHNVLLEMQNSMKNLKLISLNKNYGKGYAIRAGLKTATGNHLAYMDYDNDINPEVIRRGYEEINKNKYDIVIPSKNHKNSQVTYPKSRRTFSRIYNFIAKIIFRINCSDTQVGAKFYSKNMIRTVLPLCKVNGFAFELEMLKFSELTGFSNFLEIPVEVNLMTQSTIDFTHALQIIFDTLFLFPRMIFFNGKKYHK